MHTFQRSALSLTSFLIAAVLLVVSADASAHKVNMFAFVEGDQVFVEGYFSDGKRAQNSKVIVYDENGKELLQGETTHEGNFSFQLPKAKTLRITLNAGMGHKAEYLLSQEELAGAIPGDTAVSASVADAGQASTLDAAGGTGASGSGTGHAMGDLAIRRAVGQAILPLMRSVSQLEERSTFSDIIGGIGFIVGIGGLFFYFKARKLMRDMNATGFRNQGGDR